VVVGVKFQNGQNEAQTPLGQLGRKKEAQYLDLQVPPLVGVDFLVRKAIVERMTLNLCKTVRTR
jgi:hypothetical protein